MKQFLKRLLQFIFPLLFTVMVLAIVSKKMVNNKPVYKLEPNVKYLILGHSQPECAFNDSLISNAKNLSQGGEAYFYTYLKLKKILEENKQLQTVFVSFSNNQIEKRMDDWTYDDEHINQYFSKYSQQANSDEYFQTVKQNYKAVLSSELKSLKNNVSFLLKNQKNMLANNNYGGYLYLKRNKLDSLIKVNYIHKIKAEQSNKVSNTNINYLSKIVLLCKENNVKLVFYRTPIHSTLFSIQDEKLFQKIRNEKFKSIPFLDFHNFKLTNDEFGDFDHLNYKGAKTFSTYFNSIIQKDFKTEIKTNIN